MPHVKRLFDALRYLYLGKSKILIKQKNLNDSLSWEIHDSTPIASILNELMVSSSSKNN